jgi:hypothetical protein
MASEVHPKLYTQELEAESEEEARLRANDSIERTKTEMYSMAIQIGSAKQARELLAAEHIEILFIKEITTAGSVQA